MKLTGTITEFESPLEECDRYDIVDAVINDTRISLEWDEEGTPYYLKAESTDGVEYLGTFGEGVLEPDWKVKLMRYVARDGMSLLVMNWQQEDLGFEGSALCKIQADSA